MTTHRRAEPLRPEDRARSGPATHPPPPPPTPPGDADAFGVVHVAEAHERSDEDRQRFAGAVGSLRAGGGTLNLSERTLMILGGVIAPLGLLVVLLGWWGASRTPNLFEQVPYLISGGLFGLGLVFLGAFFYFAHWVTELVKEQRAGSAALLEAIERLHESLAPPDATAPPSHPTGHDDGHIELVATRQGSMAHRVDCVAVLGKPAVRAVSPADGLEPCKLCDPYAPEPSAG